jgi:Ser/Thr protein kinase RdoA (MazF antagonist)
MRETVTRTNPSLLLDLCRQTVDPQAKAIADHPGYDGTTVLRVATRIGPVIVKPHRSTERHRQEINAYQRWVPTLGNRAARLIAVVDDPPVIITSALAGPLLTAADLGPQQEADLHQQAGELLARYHRAEPPSTDRDIATFLALRTEHWLTVTEPTIPPPRRAEITAHLRELTQLGPLSAVPCHLDFTTRNLIVQPNGDLAVIDFEHSRRDLAARDLVRLATRLWPQRPDLEEAFLRGYGSLSDLDRQIIEHCAHLDALTAIARPYMKVLATGRPPGRS